MPLAASLAAATRKAADASALAARERVRAGLPLTEDTFYPPDETRQRSTPTPTPQPQPQTQATRPQQQQPPPARGQQAGAGAQVLQPRTAKGH